MADTTTATRNDRRTRDETPRADRGRVPEVRRDESRSSEEIRRDIRDTRSDLDETVDALADRLSPGRLVDEVWHRVRSGSGPELGSIVRDHPIPVALMGLGLGWLAVEQVTGSSGDDLPRHPEPGTQARADGRRGPYRGDAIDHDDPDWEHADASTRMKAKASRAASSARETVSGAASSAGDAASDAASSARRTASDAASTARDAVSGAAHAAGDAVSDAAHSARDGASDLADSARGQAREAGRAASRMASGAGRTARKAARRTRSGFWDLLEDQPLALGAVAFGLGLAGGLVAPSTDREDELMGHTSQTLKDEARAAGRETVRKAGSVAAGTAEAVRDEARRQTRERDFQETAREGLEDARETAAELAGQAKTAAREVAETAKEAAAHEAKKEDLTPDDLEERARRVGERTAEQARADARDVREQDEDEDGEDGTA